MKNILRTQTIVAVSTFVLSLLMASTAALAGDTLSMGGTASVENTGGLIYFDSYESNVVVDAETGDVSGYAWSEDLGWIDFGNNGGDNHVKVDMGSGVVTGVAYVSNTGATIDFTNFNSNVKVDFATGTLSGYAWSEDLGWIDFSGATLFDAKKPKIRITDIGLMEDIPDLSKLAYYFTSTKPKIKGKTEPYAKVYFEVDGDTHTARADSDGHFSIQFDIDTGRNEIEYYAIDRGGNKSNERELTLIVGEENFPESATTLLDEVVDADGGLGIPDEETEAQMEKNKVLVVDADGNTLRNKEIVVDGITYSTDSDGYVISETLMAEAVNGVYTYVLGLEKGPEGDASTLVVEDKRSYCWLWLIVLFVLLVGVFFYLRYRRSKSDI